MTPHYDILHAELLSDAATSRLTNRQLAEIVGAKTPRGTATPRSIQKSLVALKDRGLINVTFDTTGARVIEVL